MPVYVALLRAVNVDKSIQVSMPALRVLLTGMGFDDVQTLLQSGNVVLRAREESPRALELRLEAEVSRSQGAKIGFFVRSASEWSEIVARKSARD